MRYVVTFSPPVRVQLALPRRYGLSRQMLLVIIVGAVHIAQPLVPMLIYFLRVPTATVIGTSMVLTLVTMATATVLHSVTNHLVDAVLATARARRAAASPGGGDAG